VKERCAICGEQVRDTQEIAEAHDPKALAEQHDDYSALTWGTTKGVVHGQCMLDHGWEMS
jgi:hypothetical protein